MASIALLLAGCGGDLNNYTVSKPLATDLAGVYRPDARTLDLIRNAGYSAPRSIEIHLAASGKVRLFNIPDWAMGENHGKFGTSYGSWILETKPNEWAGEGKTHWAIRMDGPMMTREVDLREQKPPYVLQIIVGDPDNATAMHFQKQAT